ncbi:MAG TPA: hypothetical protein PLD19_04090 [Luteimonas sp.]|nr:hypothetical protein [Luteimonas sp.]
MNAPVSPQQRGRNRGTLVLIIVLFLGSALVAGALRFSGWRPEGSRNHGELLQPPVDLRGMSLALHDGGDYAWHPTERTWRIALAPAEGCGAPCVELSRQLDTVWQLFGHRADHVHILWIGTPPADAVRNPAWHVVEPAPALLAALPRREDAAGTPVYVIDPNGFVILRYAPGFDPGHLREDVARLLRLR